MSATVKRATYGAGCFWGVQAAFDRIKGVVCTQVGYMGGWTEDPTYEDVCTNRTGHAEVVDLRYDPERVSYEQLLEAFWNMHDPTTPNRQGPDVGMQYRSVVFYHDEEQRRAAEAMKERLTKSGRFTRPVVTEIVPAKPFWRAEEYHQKYHERRGGACRI
ncbi:MAG TPA: peptide-methionine (S)-S-oxide reductase MsrA [Methanomassiliicoccaceae archaeon]|nr:peptide-methionine (S)-S-oxide reductase MsrA [Methanomassiliicoccaceae archaeon]